MKAAVNESYGPPSSITVTDIPTQKPNNNELLIQVKYSSVNRTDCGFLRGKPFVARFFTGLIRPKYLTLGCEFAGQVVEVGENATQYKVGDNVFGFDDAAFGGHKEYKIIQENRMIHRIPANIDYKTAAISSEGAHYALFYVYRIQPTAKMKIFVHGGTGAIGSAAIQILKTYRVHITASSPTAHKITVKKLGADQVFDWQKNDISTIQDKYDVFFDAVGKSSFSEARKVLKPGGMYLSSELGKFAQNPVLALINPIQKLLTKKNIYFPTPRTRKKELVEIARLLEAGSYTPLLDTTYALKDIVKAYDYVESGQKVGNVAIRI